MSWWIATLGIGAGIAVQQAGWQIEGPALAIVGFAPLMIAIDQDLMPGFFIGPAGYMYLYHVLGWAVGPVGQLHVTGTAEFFEHGFMLSQWAVVLGLMTFALIYPLVFRGVARWSDRHAVQTDESESDWQRYTLSLLLVAFLVMAYGVYVGVGDRWLGNQLAFSVAQQTIFTAFGYVEQPMFFFLGYQAARRGGTSKALWLIVLVSHAIFSLTQGGRGLLVSAGVASAIGLVLGGVSRQKIIAVAALIAIPFVPLAGIVDAYRGAYGAAGQDFGQRLTALGDASSDFRRDVVTRNVQSSEVFLRRVTAEMADRVFEMTPSVFPFAGFESIENVPWVFVPSVLAPDRPNLSEGNQLALQYGAGAGEAGRVGFYMPTIGDAYRRFGWGGIPFFYAVASAGTAALAGLAWSRRRRRHWMAVLVLVTMQAPWITSATMIAMFWMLLWFFPKYVVFFWGVSAVQQRLWKARPAARPGLVDRSTQLLAPRLARGRH
ncbi:MAG: hypothetical protein LAO77_14460 [Acidobacteriia bacterium]|nr:hypothetical protein [Terriglobia bacterium]